MIEWYMTAPHWDSKRAHKHGADDGIASALLRAALTRRLCTPDHIGKLSENNRVFCTAELCTPVRISKKGYAHPTTISRSRSRSK